MKKPLLLVTLIATGLLSGCLMGPKYKRPAVNVPPNYRAAAPDQTAASSLGNEQWWQARRESPIARGRALTEQSCLQNVPAGLPSELLERRPDVRQAEENMVAANAQIGVAKASFFPSLSLTGLGGLESNALHRFISEPSETWSGALSVSQPVFQGGALRSGLRLASAN